MDQQWQQYGTDSSGRGQARVPHSTIQQQPNGSTQQQQPNAGYGYEAYQTLSTPSQPQSMAVSPIGTPHRRTYSGDADVRMEDADPYNSMKYPSRPTHQQRPSGQFLAQQGRYSPVKALSPSSPYPSSSQPGQSPYSHYASQNTSARQSPTRSNHYSTPSQSYYSTPSKSEIFDPSEHADEAVSSDFETATITSSTDSTRKYKS